MSERYKQTVAVVLLLQRDNKLLFEHRGPKSKIFPSHYSLPGGAVDEGETVMQAAVREAHEELGIVIDPADLSVAHVMHRGKMGADVAPIILFIMQVKKWQGEPYIAEVDKAAWVGWCDAGQVPDPAVPHVRSIIECVQKGLPYSEFGW